MAHAAPENPPLNLGKSVFISDHNGVAVKLQDGSGYTGRYRAEERLLHNACLILAAHHHKHLFACMMVLIPMVYACFGTSS